MRIGQAKGAQVGKGNTQNNTYLPTQKGARHSTRDSSSMSVTAGDNSTIHSTQTSKHTKFSIPVIGPLVSFAAVHPVVAAMTAVVVVGAGTVASGALSSSGGSTGLTRGVHLTEADNGAPPLGYDFSQTPPAVAGPNSDAIYVQGGFIYFTSGKLAHWTSSATIPTAAQCRDAVAKDPVRQVVIELGGVTCYLDSHGDPGYFTITSDPMTGNYITVDTAHLS